MRPTIATPFLAVLLFALAPATARTAAQVEPPVRDDEPVPVEEPVEDDDAGPTEEEVERAVAELERALEGDAFDEKVAAIEAVRTVHHENVVEAIVEAFDDDALEVRVAAAKALGSMPLENALDALHQRAKKKKTMEPEELAVATLNAIAMHGDPSSVRILEDDVIGAPPLVARARILGLGRIRHEDALEALVGIMNKLRVGRRGDGHTNMTEVRIALHVLTGIDQGADRRDWQRWWNDNKRDFEVPAQVPELDRKLGRQWRQYWGEHEGRRGDEDGEEPEDDEEPTDEPG